VPAGVPIFFPNVNVICSAAWPTDPKPYDKCATRLTSETIDPPTTLYAKVDGKDVDRERIASGLFDWMIKSPDNALGLPTGTYKAGSDGLWVFLKDGPKKGEHTVEFGGSFKDTPWDPPDFEGTQVTYNLTAQ